MKKELTTTVKSLSQPEDSEYVRLVSLISDVWDKAKGKAAVAVNTECWMPTGRQADISWSMSSTVMSKPSTVNNC